MKIERYIESLDREINLADQSKVASATKKVLRQLKLAAEGKDYESGRILFDAVRADLAILNEVLAIHDQCRTALREVAA